VCDGPAVRGGRGVLAAALVILGFLGLASGCGAPQPAAAPAPPPDVARILGTRVFLAAGDGKPGPLDAAGATTDPIEVSIGAQNRAFAQHLQAVGTAATVDLYGAGTHNWVYWQRELHRAWPLLTADLLR